MAKRCCTQKKKKKRRHTHNNTTIIFFDYDDAITYTDIIIEINKKIIIIYIIEMVEI